MSDLEQIASTLESEAASVRVKESDAVAREDFTEANLWRGMAYAYDHAVSLLRGGPPPVAPPGVPS